MNNLKNIKELQQVLVEQLTNKILPNGLAIESVKIDQKPCEGGGTDCMLRIQIKDLAISPRFSLLGYFDAYQKGTDLQEIVGNIINHECFEYAKHLTFDVNNLMEYEKVKDNIMCHLISDTEENAKYLENRVKVPMENTSLATVFSILVESGEEGENSIPITYKLLQTWEKSKEELHAKAKENTPRLHPATYISLDVLVDNLMNDVDVSCQEPTGAGLMAVSNTQKCKGAYTILYDGVADKLREHFQEDFFVLPSSCHEVLVLPQSYSNTKDLYQMVCEINAEDVSAEDFLADDVYVIEDNQLRSVIFSNEMTEPI